MSREHRHPNNRINPYQDQQLHQAGQVPPPGMMEVPAVRLPLTGLRAESYVIRQQAKLQKCAFDAGLDLYPTSLERITHHGFTAILWCNTGVITHIAPGFKGTLIGRSSSIDRLNGAEVVVSVIDAGYQGEILIRVRCPNLQGPIDATVKSVQECITGQTAIAQLLIEHCLVVVPVIPPLPPPPTGRGNGGFGSTDSHVPKA